MHPRQAQWVTITQYLLCLLSFLGCSRPCSIHSTLYSSQLRDKFGPDKKRHSKSACRIYPLFCLLFSTCADASC
ncbi:hypothetical protein C8Q78DRAFT_686953 [Trametes maxima]|nr:hypothetical protein C8Q78DRAFT_686953 [Trametes maxima]